ncbi:MAG: GGDEF domain-containing protein [Phycisphaerales bacterium]
MRIRIVHPDAERIAAIRRAFDERGQDDRIGASCIRTVEVHVAGEHGGTFDVSGVEDGTHATGETDVLIIDGSRRMAHVTRRLLDHRRERGVEGPVVCVLSATEASDAVDLLYAGASDVVVVDGDDARAVPLAVEKCLMHARVHAENAQLHGDLTRSLVELELKNQELERAIEQLELAARTDELTGLANRRWLNITLAGAWAEATRHDLPLGFIMIDLDGFKRLNDVAGHQRGDEILRLVGKVTAANCRAVDVAARYGGDEFSILLPHTRPDEVILVARRILAAFRETATHLPADEPPVAMSIGIGHVDASRPINADELVRHADEAMYAAKAGSGGDCVVLRDADGPRVVAEPVSSARQPRD